MCEILGVHRSSVYYEPVAKKDETELHDIIKKIFIQSKKSYGARKIKKELDLMGIIVSRKKIRKIMVIQNLVSKYTHKVFKPRPAPSNKATNGDLLKRDFVVGLPHITVVSDLTYIRVNGTWNYICLMIDLYNGAIVGWSCHDKKDTEIVTKAFASIKFPLDDIQVFHTDRGNEFTGGKIQKTLETFGILHSLSRPGTPLDNAVAESTMSILKLEFVDGEFSSLEELELKLADYINWYNYHRIHSRNSFMPPLAA